MSLLALAEESGASDDQLRVLRQLEEEGRAPSYDEYSEAIYKTLECARNAGVGIDGPYPGKSRNQPTLGWGAGGAMTEDENERLMMLHDVCHHTHSFYIERAYGLQPAAMEWEAMVFESYRVPFLDCLRGYGVEVADDADRDEIINANSDLVESVPDWEGPNCLIESGLSAAWAAGRS